MTHEPTSTARASRLRLLLEAGKHYHVAVSAGPLAHFAFFRQI